MLKGRAKNLRARISNEISAEASSSSSPPARAIQSETAATMRSRPGIGAPTSARLRFDAGDLADGLAPLLRAGVAAALGPVGEHPLAQDPLSRGSVRFVRRHQGHGRIGEDAVLAGLLAGIAVDAVLDVGLGLSPLPVLEFGELLLEEVADLGVELLPAAQIGSEKDHRPAHRQRVEPVAHL